MPTFTEADAAYRLALEGPGTALPAAFAAATHVPELDLNGNDLTMATLLRLRSFYQAQEVIKSQLGKVYAAPAADFLVETVLFYLRVAFARLDPLLRLASEKNIVAKRGSLRPDISIWRNGEVVAAVECKTQLGWNRDGWLADFESREKRLQAIHPGAKLYLLVMTGASWPGFGTDARIGNQFFVLLGQEWPLNFDASKPASIVHRLESIIADIAHHVGGDGT